MRNFIKIQEINQEKATFVNKKFITAIVDIKNGCKVFFNTQKNEDYIIIQESIDEMREMNEDFIPVMVAGKKSIVNIDNIIAISESTKGTLFQTNVNILSKLGIITGFYASDPIDQIILKIKMTDKADEKEYTKWKKQ